MGIIQTEKLLKALANRRRLAILKALAKAHELTVSDIASSIKLSFKSTSKHLIILAAADLVERRQENLNMLYRLTKPQHALVKLVISNSRE